MIKRTYQVGWLIMKNTPVAWGNMDFTITSWLKRNPVDVVTKIRKSIADDKGCSEEDVFLISVCRL